MRTRNVLIDATQGKIFSNVANTTSANASNLVAGVVIKSLNIPQGSPTTSAKVATNIGNGVNFPNNVLLISLSASVVTAPTGKSINITVKKGSTYAGATQQATLSIPAGSKTANTGVTISMTTSDYIFYDVTQVGSPQSGVGLSLSYTYYSGY